MCCTKILETHSGRQPDTWVEMVQDYGVKKAPVLSYDAADKDRTTQDIERQIKEVRTLLQERQHQ